MSDSVTRIRLPSLRQLRAARCIAEHGSISAASMVLSRTQSALTKGLADLETRLGVRLFDRSARGMTPTAQGQRFIERIGQAESALATADRVGTTTVGMRRVSSLSTPRLLAFVTLIDTLDLPAAAAELRQTRASVHTSIRHVAGAVGHRLFEKHGPRTVPTPYAVELASHVKLAFSLIRQAIDELEVGEGALSGHVVIGTLPYSRTLLTPRAIDRLLDQNPAVQVATREGPYRNLEAALRSGEIDLIIGAIRDMDSTANLLTEALLEDELAIIGRRGHPRARSRSVSKLLGLGWVLPVRGTPARALFDDWLVRHGHDQPAQIIETGSMSLVRGLLLESDRVALLSRHQALLDERAGMLAPFPVHLEGTRRPIGITRRRNTTLSAAAAALVAAFRQEAAALPIPTLRRAR